MEHEVPISMEVLEKLGIDLVDFQKRPEAFRDLFTEWFRTDEGKEYHRLNRKRRETT